ncbi:hypothetical protein JCM10213_002602 [Rhodosporidiobolus nylandii]
MEPSPPPELVLSVFVHGFKGGADTFAQFPERLQTILTASGILLEPVVYPAFDTRGELRTAVDNHIVWLTQVVAEKTALFRERGGTGPVRLVLVGHSMGGLVIADTLLSTLSSASLPILGLIAYDTPYIGLNPAVFKSTFDKAIDYASKGQAALAALGAGYGLFRSATGQKNPSPTPSAGRSGSKASSSRAATSQNKEQALVPPPAESPSATPGSGWFSLPYLVGAGVAGVAAVAAGGAAYYNRDTLAQHWTWATSHLSFVGELWKAEELEKRLQGVVDAKEKGVGFKCFYTLIPARPPSIPDRTFLILPHSPQLRSHFAASSNSRAPDEIRAHTEMFDKSDGTYALGQETARLITEWVEASRRGQMGFWTGDKGGDKAERLV